MLPILVDKYSECSMINLFKILGKPTECNCLLNKNSKTIYKRIKSFYENDPIEGFECLSRWIETNKDDIPPLELIWKFHKDNIILVTTYFYINKPYCNYFYTIFEELYAQPYEELDQRIPRAVSSVIALLLNTLNHSNDTLQLFIEEITEKLIVKIAEFIENDTLKRSPIADMKCYSNIKEECLREFAYLHLKHLLSLPSEYTIPGVVEVHTKLWTSGVLPVALKEHVNELLSIIAAEKVIDEINERIEESNLNWKYTFIIMSALAKNIDGAFLVKGVVDSWLRQSFEEDDVNSLYLPVLIARHCCFEKARYFQSYANWFSSLTLKTSKSFSLFFKFLTDILPNEPPLYLKIHINKVPSAPHGNQSLLVDYILLAKTRLADLNESGEYIGLFNDYHETDEAGQQADVARVITHYVETKEIAKPLLEAYVLRRQYYEKVFLKHLLKVPEHLDTNRGQVIHRLHSLGKVPNYLYNAWSKL